MSVSFVSLSGERSKEGKALYDFEEEDLLVRPCQRRVELVRKRLPDAALPSAEDIADRFRVVRVHGHLRASVDQII